MAVLTSTLIELLDKSLKKHGDLPVYLDQNGNMEKIEVAAVYPLPSYNGVVFLAVNPSEVETDE